MEDNFREMKFGVEIFRKDDKDQWKKWFPGRLLIRDTYYLNVFLKSAEGLVVWIGAVANTIEEATNIMKQYGERSDFLSAFMERSG